MATGPRLSVVLPARDEARAIGGVVSSVRAAVGGLGPELEIILVDDGSRDGTASVARGAAEGLALTVVRHASCRGYGAALRAGFEAARGQFVFFTDADGQFPLGELPHALALARDDVAVLGVRTRRADPLPRRVLGATWSALVRARTGVRVRDVNCAFKLFPRAAIGGASLRCDGAAVSAELLAALESAGVGFVEIPVQHRPRTHGRASGALPRVVLGACRELATLQPVRRAAVPAERTGALSEA